MTSWTPERISELKRMHAEGYSANQIARLLGGVTRNAVCGKLHRLGLRKTKRKVRKQRMSARLKHGTADFKADAFALNAEKVLAA